MALSETDKQFLAAASQIDPDTTTLSTSVPAMTFSEQGITAPDLSDVLSGVLTDMQAALGGDMSRDLTTPQGQLALSLTAIIGDKNDQLLALANNFNPDYAEGRWQDGIGRIYLIDRKEASGTAVTGTCTGLVGTVIPAGSYAQDTAGYVYRSDADATIGPNGSVDVVFTNQAFGPIECQAGTLTTIYSAVDGWSGVTNTASGVLGQEEESRANFEQRRRSQVAVNSKNTADAIYGNILNVSGVTDAYVYSNYTGGDVQRGSSNVTIPKGTLYIAVYGGADNDIANAIYQKINPGCSTKTGTTGERSAVVTDASLYPSDPKDYPLYWTVPTTIDVKFQVTIEQNESLANTIDQSIIAAIRGAFTGEDGGTRARIGQPIYASRFYGGVQDTDQNNINILNIQISRDGATFSNMLNFGIDEIPVFSSNNVTITHAANS